MTYEILTTERNVTESRGRGEVGITFARVTGRLEDGREFSFAIDENLVADQAALDAAVAAYVEGLPAIQP